MCLGFFLERLVLANIGSGKSNHLFTGLYLVSVCVHVASELTGKGVGILQTKIRTFWTYRIP